LASEKIREDAYRAAAQLVVDATADADTKLRQARFSVEARAVRDAAYAAAATPEPPPTPKLSNDTAIA